jgi:hypothetical protein
MANGNGNGQWKWIAGILGALMVGFLPGYVSNRDAPSSGQFDELQKSQQQTQVKLAVLAAQNTAMLKAIEEARKRIIVLQTRGSQ